MLRSKRDQFSETVVNNDRLPRLIPPVLSKIKYCDISLKSTLESLPLYQFQASADCLGIDVAKYFEQEPLVPGVIIFEITDDQQPRFLGMISRQRLLEFLIRPHGLDLFLHQPLRVLYSYARTKTLILSSDTSILSAAQKAMRRSLEQAGEPIVVVDSSVNEASPSIGLSYSLLNVHELNLAYWQIRGIETQVRYERSQAQMIRTEKMASLGRLVNGVAHEILDPVGFIWGNLSHLTDYHQDLMQLLTAYEDCCHSENSEVQNIKEEIEFDFLTEDIHQLLASIREGAERLKTLSTSLQNFCHVDTVYPKPADINSCIDSILLLLKSKLSSNIEIIKEYGKLPPVSCYQGQLNQVLMNILTNSMDALLSQAMAQTWQQDFDDHTLDVTEIKANPQQPTITITTGIHSLQITENSLMNKTRWLTIKIADNGPGMSPQKQQKILESFSSQTRAQKETSLSLSYHIITAKHGGQFKLRSQPGQGTEFEILLPLDFTA